MNFDKVIQEIAAGNAEALKTLYEEYRFIVYSVALSILRNKPAAEDVLQETFIRVYEKAVTYQPGTNPKAWIASIARNLSYDVLRREKKQITDDFDIKETKNTTDMSVLQRLELTEALFRLEEIERQIVVMHLVVGLKHFEISEVLGIPAGTVRWKYRKSLSRLAEIMGGDKNGAETFDFRAQR